MSPRQDISIKKQKAHKKKNLRRDCREYQVNDTNIQGLENVLRERVVFVFFFFTFHLFGYSDINVATKTQYLLPCVQCRVTKQSLHSDVNIIFVTQLCITYSQCRCGGGLLGPACRRSYVSPIQMSSGYLRTGFLSGSTLT